MSKAVLDVVAEDPEVEHVAADVRPAAVQEHRGDDAIPGELRRDQAPLPHEQLEGARGRASARAGTRATFRQIRPTVTTGHVRVGMTSRRGIMDSRVYRRYAAWAGGLARVRRRPHALPAWCSNCGTEIADKAIVCFRCGQATIAAVRKPAPPPSRWRAIFSLISLVCLALAALFLGQAGTFDGRPVGFARSVIALAVVVIAWRIIVRRRR